MYFEHPSFAQPENEDVKVWRYIDFTKLVSMLDTRSLYFTRSDKFGDPFEGSYPRTNFLSRHLTPKDLSEQERDIYHKLAPDFSRIAREHRKYAGVNCWHMNEHESAAMWKLYLKSNEGVSIQSTYSKLRKCFVGDGKVYVGIIKYIDYKTGYIKDVANLFAPLMHKRISFAHECEVRAVVYRAPNPLPGPGGGVLDLSVETMRHGVQVKVDLDVLVERIYVAPDAPEWFRDLVKSAVSQYGHKFEVIDSSLSERPIF